MLPLLLWLVVGMLPGALVAFGHAGWVGAVLTGLVVAVLTALLFGEVTWQRLLLAGAGLGLAALQHAAPWRSYEDFLLRGEAFVELQGIVTDTGLPESEDLAWLADSESLELKVQRLRLSSSEPWQEVGGTVLVRRLPLEVRYGQEIMVSGALKVPWQAELPDLFDYRNHLKVKGIAHILYAEEARLLTAKPQGWRRGVAWLLGQRETVLERLLHGIDQPENQVVLAAMTLGFRQGLTAEDRAVYLRSGMIHLFAISGLHVGILFSVLMMVLLVVRVPFAMRYLLGPWLLLIYVIATGGAPSAVRAWLMITIWSLGKGLKLPAVSINAVLTAAFILLLVNPFYLFQGGFQFSFVIVLSLIWGWRQAQGFIHYLHEKQQWVPARHRGRQGVLQKLEYGVIKSFMSMLCAWLGGMGLSAFYNQLFLPTSVFSNMSVFLLAFVIIWLSSLKLLVSLIVPWGLENVVAAPLEWSLSLLRFLAEFSSDYGGATLMPTPALWAVLIYYVVLGALFLSLQRLRRVAVMAALLALVVAAMVLWPRQPPATTRVTVLMPAGSLTPAILVQMPYRHRQPILINAGSRELGYSLGDWLRHQGIGTLDRLVLTHNTRDFYGGMERLLEDVHLRSLTVAADNRRQRNMFEAAAWEEQARWRFVYRPDNLSAGPLVLEREMTRDVQRLILSWPEADGLHTLTLVSTLDRSCTIELTAPQQPPRRWELIYADHLRLLTID